MRLNNHEPQCAVSSAEPGLLDFTRRIVWTLG